MMSQLRDLQTQWLLNNIELHDRFTQLLDVTQLAEFQLLYPPSPDLYRFAVLACTRIVHEHASQRWLHC